MEDHIVFIFYIFTFLFSTIGYGFLFSKYIHKEFVELNLGYQGILGFFILSLISMITIFFFKHGYFHNIFIHSIGLILFLVNIFKDKKKKTELRFIILLTLLLIIGTYVFKNHDDFPYYHLTYTLNLTNNSFIVGSGIFSHGFRTFSSLFYYHSLLFLPKIKFYLFHIGPFFILVFFNYVILFNLREKIKEQKINFIYYFSLLSLIFINIVFYRLGEHGTDRSAQILLLLIFILFFEVFYFKKNNKNLSILLSIMIVIIFLASSMKAIYYLYLIIIPIVIYKSKVSSFLLNLKTIPLIIILFLSLSINLTINYFSTGCFLYPAEKTCLVKQKWSIDSNEVKSMSTHYEWWSKAGGGPGYKSEVSREDYIKNFNWLNNWIDRHFFNKVLDTLVGILLISLIVFFYLYFNSKKKQSYKKKLNFSAYILPLLFLCEWFLNHPSMRYGGYVLFAIPLFMFASVIFDGYKMTRKKILNFTIIFISISFLVFIGRNIKRIDKEINFYKYDILNSPFFYVKKVNYYQIKKNKDLEIYSTKNNDMCWSSKTPCSYVKNLALEKFLWMNMVFKNDK